MKKILIIQGHPNASNEHFCDAIAEKYTESAMQAGFSVSQVNVAELNFPLLESQKDFDRSSTNPDIMELQKKILWADHLVIIYPLWLGGMPALLKGVLEQVLRPGFAFEIEGVQPIPQKLLKGKSARLFVTMGMPGLFYRWYYRAHTVKSLKRNILQFCGIKPVRYSCFGRLSQNKQKLGQRYLVQVSRLAELGK